MKRVFAVKCYSILLSCYEFLHVNAIELHDSRKPFSRFCSFFASSPGEIGEKVDENVGANNLKIHLESQSLCGFRSFVWLHAVLFFVTWESAINEFLSHSKDRRWPLKPIIAEIWTSQWMHFSRSLLFHQHLEFTRTHSAHCD